MQRLSAVFFHHITDTNQKKDISHNQGWEVLKYLYFKYLYLKYYFTEYFDFMLL